MNGAKRQVKKVVLTGGPCSGKTTVQQVLRETFPKQLIHVPEAATLLLQHGFEVPTSESSDSEHVQARLQGAVLKLQYTLEDIYTQFNASGSSRIVVFDRGILDGAAYTPGGLPEFSRRFGVDLQAVIERYDVVVHLESVATASSESYGRANNAQRFESLEEAQQLEYATRKAWSDHPRRHFVKGTEGVDGKVAETCRIIRELLADE